MKNILLTDATGTLGVDLLKILQEKSYNVIATDSATLDITDKSKVDEFLSGISIDLIIHTAAYTNVDKAELNPDKAFKINYYGTKYLALWAKKLDIPIIYTSTGYVFDGMKDNLYKPDDEVCPLNIYGASKARGEAVIRKNCRKYYIVRTGWIYGESGENFLKALIKLASNRQELAMVDDQKGSPTWSMDLSLAILSLINNNSDYGTYHFCNSGEVSWFEFAKKIFEIASINTAVIPIKTRDYPRPAKRPLYAAMDNKDAMRDWEEALNEFFALSKLKDSFLNKKI